MAIRTFNRTHGNWTAYSDLTQRHACNCRDKKAGYIYISIVHFYTFQVYV